MAILLFETLKVLFIATLLAYLAKNETINLMQNADFTGALIKHKNLLSRIKMGNQILTFGNIEIKNKSTAIRLLCF